MKKQLILLVLMMQPLLLIAREYTIDNITYELQSYNTAMVVSISSNYTGDVVIPDSINYLRVVISS